MSTIGRTGRAGRPGLAQPIVTRAETKYVQSIEKLTGKPIDGAAKADVSPRRPRTSSREADGTERRDRQRAS